MKNSYGIKKLYGGAEREYGGGGRICRKNNVVARCATGARELLPAAQ